MSVPKQTRELDAEVQWFAEQMQDQLEANKERGDWKQVESGFAEGQILRNLAEATSRGVTDKQAIRSFVDAANFLLMLAYRRAWGLKGRE